MSCITIFSGSYCHGDEIAEQVAQSLGYSLAGSEVLEEASRQYDVPYEKLYRAVHSSPSWLNNVTREREKCIAYIKAAFAEILLGGNTVYHGYIGHLLPSDLSQILRVCVVADHEFRVNLAKETDGIPESKALQDIEEDDVNRCRWTQSLSGHGPWDRRLYDLKLPIHTMAVDAAVEMIVDNVKKISLQTSPESERIMRDFALSAKVNVALVEQGYDTDVTSEDGHVQIASTQASWRSSRMQAKIEDIARAVPDVKEATAHVGSALSEPYHRRYDFKVHPRILLVDDEKEYVLTLSERLQMRNIPSQVLHDGQQALSYVRDEAPDVIVLDLNMPGIHGLDVLRQIKQDHPNVEVIILTGHGTDEDHKIAQDLGAFAYLQKPVDIDRLAQTMKNAYSKIERNELSEKARET